MNDPERDAIRAAFERYESVLFDDATTRLDAVAARRDLLTRLHIGEEPADNAARTGRDSASGGSMNDPVIEAAVLASQRETLRQAIEDGVITSEASITAAIRAADAHRAEAVRDAVRALELDAQRYGVFPSPQGSIRLRASRAALLRLVGAEETE